MLRNIPSPIESFPLSKFDSIHIFTILCWFCYSLLKRLPGKGRDKTLGSVRMTCQVGPVESHTINHSRGESDTIGQTFAVEVDSGGEKGTISRLLHILQSVQQGKMSRMFSKHLMINKTFLVKQTYIINKFISIVYVLGSETLKCSFLGCWNSSKILSYLQGDKEVF